MCGIVGVAGVEPADVQAMARAREALAHRGPDSNGCWLSDDCRIAFGHCRLAIIDLSPGGHQPMADGTGDLRIVLNGEIYNYRELRRELEGFGFTFRSQSDTEVLLASYRQWGTDCLARLNGMFAFGLYDARRRSLFLARDRAGEKPLFYSDRAGTFAFASELKALMQLPLVGRSLDTESLQYYLTYGYVPLDRCILRGVHKLPAAHALTYDVDEGAIRRWRYWTLPEPPSNPASEPELRAELEHLLEDSVRRQLIADVPVGVLLSGGIDSGLIAATAARISSRPVRTFTVSFPGHGSYDEGPIARRLASHFGTEHMDLPAQDASVDLLPLLARQYDEPIADSSMIPTFLVSRLIRQHATVALSGDGGDELFGGYPHYSMLIRQRAIRSAIPRPLRALGGAAAAHLLPVGLKGRNHLIGLSGDTSRSVAHINVYFDATARRRLLRPVLASGVAEVCPESYKRALTSQRYSVLRQATETDFHSTMVDAYLVKVDRASMLNALEVPAPWLDYRLVEFAFGRVPDSLRATGDERKILPRRLAAQLYPPEVDLHRKQGFSIPLSEWLKGEWGRYVERVVLESDPTLFDRRVIARLAATRRQGFANSQRLFALTMFELWRREYGIRA